MAKSSVMGRNRGSKVGHLIPVSPSILEKNPDKNGCLVPRRRKQATKAMLNGDFVQRKPAPDTVDHVVWDTVLAGFGLQVRRSGNSSWIVKFRQREKPKKVTLARCVDLDANDARVKAREMLAQATLDGLPKRPKAKIIPLFRIYSDEFSADYFHPWKPATQRSNRGAIERELIPFFGALPVNEIRKTDILRWRDSCSAKQGVFNRAIPVLSSMLQYAARLGYCRPGSNVARATPRYKRPKLERYLSPLEYRSFAAQLRNAEAAHPVEVAVLRMLLFTGARVSEITTLRWSWVDPPRLKLPDSKTGPKTIYLNRQAEAVLAAQPRRQDGDLVFPSKRGAKPVLVDRLWVPLRKRAGFPDMRLHDLRHSFASAAIMDNVPLATIGKLRGHVLHETTARYAHLADDIVADAANRVSGSIATCLGLGQ